MSKKEEPTKYMFGVKGVWHKSASENTHARDIPATILELNKMGLLYIFTSEPIIRGYDSLNNRTATVFADDFTVLTPEDLKNDI
jgi:hypothetical protein